MQTDQSDDPILGAADVARMIGVSKTTIERWEFLGTLPPRRQYGPRLKGWPRSVIRRWIDERPEAENAARKAVEARQRRLTALVGSASTKH